MENKLENKEKQPEQDWSDIYAFIRALGNLFLVIVAIIGYIFTVFYLF